jgi:hypothetical protein
LNAERLAALHERLCFQRAYPRSVAERRRADAALARFERRVAPFMNGLANTGIAGTTYRYSYNYRMARWLAGRYGRAVTIDWVAYKRHAWDEVAGLLGHVVAWAETDGLDDDDTGSWDWVRGARGRSRLTDLRWLLERMAGAGLPGELARQLYETCQLPLVWDLAGGRDSITSLTLPVRRLFAERRVMKERPADFGAAAREPIGSLRPVPALRAARYIDAARAALSLREREFHVIVHANRAETFLVECGRGLEIAVFGLERELRLAIEADYGCLLLRNGVPIGYAYAAIAFERCDIGINIFPEYREGESAYTFTKVTALFHRHFGSRTFVMRRYQIGHGNPEGIEAGSFWFFWKLGFRPVAPRVRELGEREAGRLARRRGARTGEAMLRRLARSDMVFATDGRDLGNFRDYDVAAAGRAVTRLIERDFEGDRTVALRRCAERVARALGVRSFGERMAPLLALIPDLDRWPAREKAALAAAARAKEARRERSFVLAMLRAERFRRFVAAFR